MRIVVLVSAVLFVVACGHEFEPPDRAQRVEQVAATYTDALFDSVSWTSSEARLQEGNAVYAADCRRCHGQLGRGATPYVRERGLEVPSMVEPEWRLDDLDLLRREIYIGHETGMPTFGQSGLSLWQVDAVAAYVLEVLRPDVLGPTG